MEINGKYFRSFTEREEALKNQYSAERIRKQHSKGKLTAHERIALLFDEGTFEEIDAYVTPSDQGVEFGKVELLLQRSQRTFGRWNQSQDTTLR